jgi:ABC-type uncharacterized transport system substrate-binding protein
MTRRALLVLGLVALLAPSLAPAAALAPSGLTLVTVDGVPAFEDAVRGFLGEEPDARVIRLESDLGNARSLLEEEAARSPARVVAFGSQASVAVSRWLSGRPAVYGFILSPSRLPETAGEAVCYSLTIDAEVRLQAMARLFPKLETVTVLAGPDGGEEAERLVAAGRRMNCVVRVITVRQASEIARAVRGIEGATRALLLTTEPLFLKPEIAEAILLATLERRVPVIGFSERLVTMGGLASLEIDYAAYAAELARAARTMAAAPARNDVRNSRQYRWVVNTGTARTLGIDIPRDILSATGATGGAGR